MLKQESKLMDNYTPRLKELYTETIVPKLKEKLSRQNTLSLPKLSKVSLNMGLGDAVNDNKVIQSASDQLAVISGQLPLVTKARKSIAKRPSSICRFKIPITFTPPFIHEALLKSILVGCYNSC